MCGIFGSIGLELKKEDVASVLSKISHRGPDDSGIYLAQDRCQTEVVLAQVRLSILDLSSAGHQPMCYQNLVLIYNGEIYNYKALREDLIAKGYTFLSDSDTEVILKGYHCYGKNFIEKMIGMFAFAIYDSAASKLVIYRDRMGVKPLYYLFDPDQKILIFASELKAIKQTLAGSDKKLSLSISQVALQLYLLKGYIPSPFSIYDNVHKLRPGHYMEYDLANTQVRESCYWNLETFYKKEKLDLPYSEIKSRLKELLIDACSLRMIADVPVGVFLSGGVDSNLVTALLSKECGYSLKTFSLGVSNSHLNEADFAKSCAKALGTEHHELYLSSQNFLPYLKDFFTVFDEPFGDSSAIPTLALSKFVKQYVGVALSADGGDELFGGYAGYIDIPHLWKKTRLNLLSQAFIRGLASLVTSKDFKRKLNEALSLSQLNSFAEFYWQKNTYFKVHELKKLLGRFLDVKALSFESGEGLSKLDIMMLIDGKYYLPDDVLVKVDRATMFYSLEGREPLLDHRLFEFCAQIPMKYKVNGNKTKIIARDILSEYMDLELLVKRKQGFSIPIKEWYASLPIEERDNVNFMTPEMLKFYHIPDTEERSIHLKWLLFVLLQGRL